MLQLAFCGQQMDFLTGTEARSRNAKHVQNNPMQLDLHLDHWPQLQHDAIYRAK